MLIPHLHFCGGCEKAIVLYKAFKTKAESIVHNYDYAPDESQGDNGKAHAAIYIHGQKIFLHESVKFRFGSHCSFFTRENTTKHRMPCGIIRMASGV